MHISTMQITLKYLKIMGIRKTYISLSRSFAALRLLAALQRTTSINDKPLPLSISTQSIIHKSGIKMHA